MKKNAKLLILSLIAAFAFSSALTACGGGSTAESNSDVASGSQDVESAVGGDSSIGGAEEEEVTISLAATESVVRFASKQLTATVKGSQEKLVWSSSNPAVATVDAETGLVSALTLGEAVITASIGDVSASCTVTVVETDIPHEIEISLDEISVFEGKASEEITVEVSYNNEVVEGDFEYTWLLLEGDEDVVSIATEENGKSVIFTGLKPGTVTYEIYTVARGYEASREITITVKENVYALGISHESILVVDNGYAVDLTLGDEATDNVSFGDAYLAINGAPSEESVTVSWTPDNDNAIFENGTLTAQKVGKTVLTGTATYNGKTLTVTLTATIQKGQVTLEDTDFIEVVKTETFNIPESVNKGEIEKVYLGANVLFDKAEGKGSIAGNGVTVDKAGLPTKDEDLGLGKSLMIETNLIVYTMSVDVYTMIIDSAEELEQWQEVAAENAIKAGLCIEEQKGLAYNGYFVLGEDIKYNKEWTPYKKYGELWALCYQNKNVWKAEYQSEYDAIGNSSDRNKIIEAALADGKLLDGTIVEDWGRGQKGGFKGVFDGQGHYIEGLSTANGGEYNAFIVTFGGGTVKNVVFTDMTIGSNCGSVVDRGDGLLENIYLKVSVIENGKAEDRRTWGLIRSSNGPKHTLRSCIIDYSDADLSDLPFVYLGCDITSETLEGVYLFGVPETYTGDIWNHEGVAGHQLGVYATMGDLMADANALAVVESWTGMWEVTEHYVLPTCMKEIFSGDFEVVVSTEKVPADSSIEITTNRSQQYMLYSLKEEVEGVSVEGNVVSVAANATVGATFTVVVTSALDGKTVEKTFSVDKLLERITAQQTVDVDLGIHLNGAKVVKGETATVALDEIYESHLQGKTVTVKYGKTVIYEGTIDSAQWTMPLDAFAVTAHGADSLVFTYSIPEKNAEITLPINLVQANVELNSTNVTNATALKDILNSNPYGNYVLTSDLNLGGSGLKVVESFNGVLDGQGYMIKNTYLHHDSDTNGYNPQWIKVNTGTIKNIGFDLGYMTYTTGGRTRGLVATNEGAISGVYVNVYFNQAPLETQTDTSYFFTGVISGTNVGTIENVLVNVTAMEGLILRENTMAGVVYNNQGTLTNCYTLNNGMDFISVAQKGASNTCVLYNTWADLTADDVAALGTMWKQDGTVLYFGHTVVYDTTVREIVEDLIKSDVNKVATLENAAFTVGSQWSVVVNGVSNNVTVDTEGKIAVTLDPANVTNGYLATIDVKSTTQELRYTNVVLATYISTVEELVALAVGGKAGTGYHANSDVVGNDIYGYYVLSQDLDFANYTANDGLVAGGYSYQKSFFQGVFDGNGKTIKNIKVGAGGIFGGMKNAEVKNVNFTDVTYADNNSKDGFHGNYTALFASYTDTVSFSDISITVKAAHTRVKTYPYLDGLFVSMVQNNTSYKNISVDASYIDLLTVLGSRVIASTTYENVSIKAASYEAIGYNGSKADYPNNSTVLLTAWPAGVTYEQVSVNIPNAIKSFSGNTKYYGGDVTALGFAEGSHVYKVESGDLWNDRVIIPGDEAYDYVEFDIVLTKAAAYLTAWPYTGSGTNGSFQIFVSGCTISTDAAAKVRTVQIFKANGDVFATQSRDNFEANTKYTIRIGFNNDESIAGFNLSSTQTYYISNSRFGNYTDTRVYVGDTGAVIPYYTGDVTALGFAAGTKVSATTITDPWSGRVRVDGDMDYDYVEVAFSVDKAIGSLCVWTYGMDGLIIPGNYSVTAAGGSAVNGAVERKITITDANGNAVSAFAANTVYKLRIYLDDTAAIACVSTFDAKAANAESGTPANPVTMYFGNVTCGNDAN